MLYVSSMIRGSANGFASPVPKSLRQKESWPDRREKAPVTYWKKFSSRCAGWRKRITMRKAARRIIFIRTLQKKYWPQPAGQPPSASRKKSVRSIFCGLCCRNRRVRQHNCCCVAAWINTRCWANWKPGWANLLKAPILSLIQKKLPPLCIMRSLFRMQTAFI